MTELPNAAALGAVAAQHLPPILYALEVCAVSMDAAGRSDEARYYRALARELAEAASTDQGTGDRE